MGERGGALGALVMLVAIGCGGGNGRHLPDASTGDAGQYDAAPAASTSDGPTDAAAG
jgi:hypothetical protein